MWDVIRGLVREGTTLLLTTQYLEEADELADTIAVVDHGKIIARGTADELKSQVGGERIEVVVHDRTDIDARGEILARSGAARRRVDEHTRRADRPADGGAKALVQSSATSTTRASRSTTSACAGRRSTTSSSRLTGHAAESRTPTEPASTSAHDQRPRPARRRAAALSSAPSATA